MTEGGADKGARHQRGGNVWVRQRQRRLVAVINDNKGSSRGEVLFYHFTWRDGCYPAHPRLIHPSVCLSVTQSVSQSVCKVRLQSKRVFYLEEQ